MTRTIPHFIGGSLITPDAGRFADVFEPSTGAVQARVPLADADEVHRVVGVAEQAQPAWAATNPQKRARVLLRFLELVQREMQPLAELLASEHGKTVDDAKGDIQRGLEVIEFSAGAPHLLKGEYS